MQTVHGRLQTRLQNRIPIVSVDRLYQFRSEEFVFGDVDFVSRTKKNVVDILLASVVQPDSHASADGLGRNNLASEPDGDIAQPIDQPARPSGADRTFAQSVLQPAWKFPDEIRPGHKLADARWAHVRGRIEQMSYESAQPVMQGPRGQSPSQ